MVSLTLMARLLEAVRPTARLVLVGDPDQLSSVEAGAVLADIARAPGAADARLTPALAELGAAVADERSASPRRGAATADLAVRRRHRRRSPGRSGRPIPTLRWRCCAPARADVGFVEVDLEADPELRAVAATAGVAEQVRGAGSAYPRRRAGRRHPRRSRRRWTSIGCSAPTGAGRSGSPGGARRPSAGWPRPSRATAQDGEWYLGRPLLVTANDYEMGLYNGDTGVIVAARTASRAPRSPAGPRPRSIPRSGWTRSRPCTR